MEHDRHPHPIGIVACSASAARRARATPRRPAAPGDAALAAVVNRDSGNVSVLQNQSSGTFAPAVNYAVGVGPRSAAAADLNGDGRPDLAVTDSWSDTVTVLLTACFP